MATTPQTTDRIGQFREAAREWDAAWAARDLDRAVSVYTDDVVWKDSSLARPIHGKTELRRYCEALLRVA